MVNTISCIEIEWCICNVIKELLSRFAHILCSNCIAQLVAHRLVGLWMTSPSPTAAQFCTICKFELLNLVFKTFKLFSKAGK